MPATQLDSREKNIMKLRIKKIGKLVDVETQNEYLEKREEAKKIYRRKNRLKIK